MLRPIAEQRVLTSWEDICAYAAAEWFPSRLTFGKFKGRDFRDAHTDSAMRGWLKWLADSSNARNAKMGRWYLSQLERETQQNKDDATITTVLGGGAQAQSSTISLNLETGLAIYVNPELEQLRQLIAEATHDHFQYFLSPYLNPGLKEHKDVAQGTIFYIEVPFVGAKRSFDLKPLTSDLNPPHGHVEDDRLIIYVVPRNQLAAAVQHQFEETLVSVERYLEWQRATLQDFPMSFSQAAHEAIGARLDKLRNDRAISAGLKYPLKTRVNAPSTILPLVRKRIRPVPVSFSSTPTEAQPVLAEEHYLNILSIMENMARAMEYGPAAFATMGEEAIGFAFLVQLNGQYEGSATGETFNLRGKSDILIREKNTNLFVAECKVWSGPKDFADAIDQLQRYVTWRDTKTALVVFNRNKGFSSVIQRAQEILAKHPQFKSGPVPQSDTRFRYVFRNLNDDSRDYSLMLLMFDIPAPPLE